MLAAATTAAIKLSAVAAASEHFVVAPSMIVEELAPRNLPVETVAALHADLASMKPISLFDPRFAERLRSSMQAASPWVLDVRRVERLFPNRVRVDLDLRTPIASLDDGTRRYVVDADCRVLLSEPLIGRTTFDETVLSIKGLDRRIDVGLGASLAAVSSVRAAVAVAEELRLLPDLEKKQLFDLRPVAIDVSAQRNGVPVAAGMVWIETANGVGLSWGRAQEWRDDNHEPLGLTEPAPVNKVRNLTRVEQMFPGLTGLEEVFLAEGLAAYRPLGGQKTYLSSRDASGRGR